MSLRLPSGRRAGDYSGPDWGCVTAAGPPWPAVKLRRTFIQFTLQSAGRNERGKRELRLRVVSQVSLVTHTHTRSCLISSSSSYHFQTASRQTTILIWLFWGRLFSQPASSTRCSCHGTCLFFSRSSHTSTPEFVCVPSSPNNSRSLTNRHRTIVLRTTVYLKREKASICR